MPLVYLSLGSNKGDRLRALALAYREISERIGKVVDISSIYETEPWGFESEHYFLNLVLCIESLLEPAELIRELMNAELRIGRQRQEGAYQPREIDMDILIYDNQVIDSIHLQIPHPRMHMRKFVLEPLVELAPLVIHPVFGITASQLLDVCEDTTHTELRYEQEQVCTLFEKALSSNP